MQLWKKLALAAVLGAQPAAACDESAIFSALRPCLLDPYSLPFADMVLGYCRRDVRRIKNALRVCGVKEETQSTFDACSTERQFAIAKTTLIAYGFVVPALLEPPHCR